MSRARSLADTTYRLLNRFRGEDHDDDDDDDEDREEKKIEPVNAMEIRMLAEQQIDEQAEYKTVEWDDPFEVGLCRFVTQLANRVNNTVRRNDRAVDQTIFDYSAYITKRDEIILDPGRSTNQEILFRCFDEAAYAVQRTMVAINLLPSSCCQSLSFAQIVQNQTSTTRFINLVASIYTECRIRRGLKYAPKQQLAEAEKDRIDVLKWFMQLDEVPVSDIEDEASVFHSINPSLLSGTVVLVRSIPQDVVLMITQACCESVTKCLTPETTGGQISDALIGQMASASDNAVSILRTIGRQGANPSEHMFDRNTYELIEQSFVARVLFVDLVSIINAHIVSQTLRTDARKVLSGILLVRQKEIEEWFRNHFE